jgi:hypothetical protein
MWGPCLCAAALTLWATLALHVLPLGGSLGELQVPSPLEGQGEGEAGSVGPRWPYTSR